MSTRAGSPLRPLWCPSFARRLGPGQVGTIGCPYRPAWLSQCPRTFMRSRFLDNFVFRSAAMVASAQRRTPAASLTAHARSRVRSCVALVTRAAPLRPAAPPLRVARGRGLSAGALLTERLGKRAGRWRGDERGRSQKGQSQRRTQSMASPSRGPPSRDVGLAPSGAHPPSGTPFLRDSLQTQ